MDFAWVQICALSIPVCVTCCCSFTKSCLTFCDPMDCSMTNFPVLHHLPEFAQTHGHCIGDAIQPSHPLPSLLFLSSVFPKIRVFPDESVLHIWWPKYWSFSFSISPSNEYSGSVPFRIDRLDLLAAQGTLQSSLTSQIESICFSALNLLYDPTLTTEGDCWEKTIALTIWTLVSKEMSPRFNMLPRFVIAFLQGASVF